MVVICVCVYVCTCLVIMCETVLVLYIYGNGLVAVGVLLSGLVGVCVMGGSGCELVVEKGGTACGCG